MARPFWAPLDAVAATVPVTPLQSATIVSEISVKLERWVDAKNPATVVVPAIQDVSILQGGSVWWCRGHAVPATGVVPVLGALLALLVDDTDAHRAPAGLLYVVARATDPRHLAPFSDLGEFRRTLGRYASPRPDVAMDALVARYAVACSGLPPLGLQSTISDVRRLRRASGVPLAQIAADTMIPLSLLRELEWGVFTHWSLEHARGAIDLYAERAGLNGDAVARVIEREPALLLPERAALPVQVTVPARASTRKSSLVPFALAASMLAACLVGAPPDRSPSRAPAPTTVREAVAPKTASSAAPELPAAEPPTTLTARRQVVAPVVETGWDRRLSRLDATPVPRRDRRADQRQHPLWKFAHALAGDGRYKVQPFPRVEEDR